MRRLRPRTGPGRPPSDVDVQGQVSDGGAARVILPGRFGARTGPRPSRYPDDRGRHPESTHGSGRHAASSRGPAHPAPVGPLAAPCGSVARRWAHGVPQVREGRSGDHAVGCRPAASAGPASRAAGRDSRTAGSCGVDAGCTLCAKLPNTHQTHPSGAINGQPQVLRSKQDHK